MPPRITPPSATGGAIASAARKNDAEADGDAGQRCKLVDGRGRPVDLRQQQGPVLALSHTREEAPFSIEQGVECTGAQGIDDGDRLPHRQHDADIVRQGSHRDEREEDRQQSRQGRLPPQLFEKGCDRRQETVIGIICAPNQQGQQRDEQDEAQPFGKRADHGERADDRHASAIHKLQQYGQNFPVHSRVTLAAVSQLVPSVRCRCALRTSR